MCRGSAKTEQRTKAVKKHVAKNGHYLRRASANKTVYLFTLLSAYFLHLFNLNKQLGRLFFFIFREREKSMQSPCTRPLGLQSRSKRMPTRKLKLIKRRSDCVLTKLIFHVCSSAHPQLSYFGMGSRKRGNSSRTFQPDSISHSTRG